MEKLKIPNSLLKDQSSYCKSVGFRITPREEELINKIARENHISKTDVIRLAIKSLEKQLV